MSNKQIANIYYEKLAALGLRKAGMVDNPRYIVIHKSNMPAFIITTFFFTYNLFYFVLTILFPISRNYFLNGSLKWIK